MSDTIAAIATAVLPAAIGIVRISGGESAAVLDRVFRPAGGGRLSEKKDRTMVLGDVLDREGRTIEVSISVLKLIHCV